MLTINNGLEVAVLYRLEGMQPFTRKHVRPLVAALPFAAVALAARALLPGVLGVSVGSLLGLGAYAATVQYLGFTRIERRLWRTLVDRYRVALSGMLDG